MGGRRRDADELFIQSRDEKPLGRYCPKLIEPLRTQFSGTHRDGKPFAQL
jgi:hypothetical protein